MRPASGAMRLEGSHGQDWGGRGADTESWRVFTGGVGEGEEKRKESDYIFGDLGEQNWESRDRFMVEEKLRRKLAGL